MEKSAFIQPPQEIHWRLMQEAAKLIREYRGRDRKTGELVSLCPEHFKKNIRKFLLNCMAQVPYIASWHWAIHCLKQGWCKWAPFKYFKMVLLNPRKHKVTDIKPWMDAQRQVGTFLWLKRTKGRAAAFTWANTHDFGFNGFTVEDRKAWQIGEKAIKSRIGFAKSTIRDAAIARILEQESLAEFEHERAFRKGLLVEKGWNEPDMDVEAERALWQKREAERRWDQEEREFQADQEYQESQESSGLTQEFAG